jgi:hypothetical protein
MKLTKNTQTFRSSPREKRLLRLMPRQRSISHAKGLKISALNTISIRFLKKRHSLRSKPRRRQRASNHDQLNRFAVSDQNSPNIQYTTSSTSRPLKSSSQYHIRTSTSMALDSRNQTTRINPRTFSPSTVSPSSKRDTNSSSSRTLTQQTGIFRPFRLLAKIKLLLPHTTKKPFATLSTLTSAHVMVFRQLGARTLRPLDRLWTHMLSSHPPVNTSHVLIYRGKRPLCFSKCSLDSCSCLDLRILYSQVYDGDFVGRVRDLLLLSFVQRTFCEYLYSISTILPHPLAWKSTGF